MSNHYFEVVQIEQEEEEVFDLAGIAEAEGWDQTELMYFVFESATKKGFGGGVSGKAAGFFGQGGVASAMGGMKILGPTGWG